MSKGSRPAVFSLDSLMVKPKASELASAPAPEPSIPVGKELTATFRTSVYFARSVHDKLRAIAFEERKTITDLINEGLDHVLTSRNYPTTAELRKTNKM